MKEIEQWPQINVDDIPSQIQKAGVAGAGGAGFPTYVKWENINDVSQLLINHQESEPNYYADKWLGQSRAPEIASLAEFLLEAEMDLVVIGTKLEYRAEWMEPLESKTNATVVEPEALPITAEESSGTVIVYTPSVYTYSEESTLLTVTAGVHIKDELPTDHGWIVQNTETMHNIHRAVVDEAPVTRKYVHVDGVTPRHRCLEVPIGTTGETLLEAAGLSAADMEPEYRLVDGGPGWCYEITEDPEEFGTRKRTNSILVLTEEEVRENKKEDGEISVLNERDWSESDDRLHEKSPSTITPEIVRIPLITNSAYKGFVHPSVPTVSPGEYVKEGEVIAKPSPEGISNYQHASIEGTVTDVTSSQIVIES